MTAYDPKRIDQIIDLVTEKQKRTAQQIQDRFAMFERAYLNT